MWQRTSTHGTSPTARCAHAAVICTNLYVFGGWNGSIMLDDLHVFQIDTKTWSKPIFTGTAPQCRAGHSATACGHLIYIFGGGDGSVFLNDMHVLDTETLSWSQAYVSGTPPAARSRHSATLISGNRILIFGGGDERRVYDDIYCLDIATMSWSRLRTNGTPPAPRWAHTASLVREKLYIFGGRDGDRLYDDLHVLDIESMTWSQPQTSGSQPIARAAHTCSIIGECLYFFGGGDGNRMLNEIVVYNTETFVWSRPHITGTSPTSRCAHSASATGSRIIVFGGSDGNRRFKDIYILNTEQLAKNKDEVPKEDARKMPSVRSIKGYGTVPESSDKPSATAQETQQNQIEQQHQHQQNQASAPAQYSTSKEIATTSTTESGTTNEVTQNIRPASPLTSSSQQPKQQRKSSFAHITGDLPMDIRGWLQLHNMAKYTDLFLREEIDLLILPYITENDLEKIGVDTLGARRRIMLAITQLKLSQNSVHYPILPAQVKMEAQSSRPNSPNNNVLLQKIALDLQQLVTDISKLNQ